MRSVILSNFQQAIKLYADMRHFNLFFLLPFPLPAAGLYPAAIGKADGAEISSFIPKRSHRVCFGDFLQTKALINCRAKLKLMAVCFRMKKDQ